METFFIGTICCSGKIEHIVTFRKLILRFLNYFDWLWSLIENHVETIKEVREHFEFLTLFQTFILTRSENDSHVWYSCGYFWEVSIFDPFWEPLSERYMEIFILTTFSPSPFPFSLAPLNSSLKNHFRCSSHQLFHYHFMQIPQNIKENPQISI